MKCYSNKDNPVTLKLLIASNINQIPIDLHLVNFKEWKTPGIKRLPVLELSNGSTIVSSNVAAQYLYKSKENVSDQIDEWLEWDSAVLQPAVFRLNPDKPTDDILFLLLDKIEATLQNTTFLVHNEISLADIAVWSSLFGVFTHQNFSKGVTRTRISTWFDTIRNLEPVNSAVKKWGSKKGTDVLKAFAEAIWFPTVNMTMENVKKCSDDSVDTTQAKEAPSEKEKKLAKEAWLAGTSSRPKLQFTKTPVLPQLGKKNILITSALPYVNNVPHLGNIIGCVLSADVFARYCRLRNWNTLYIAGTDEYGTATETKALEEQLTPQQICDKYYQIHKDTYSWFNIAFDHFGRTTTNEQKEITQELFWDVYNNDYTFVASMEQLHCEACSRFLADRFVEGTCPKCKYEDARGDQCDGCGQLINAIELIKPRCKLCGAMPIVKNSDQLFLELPKIEPTLQEWIQKSSGRWTHNARSITNTWLKNGLQARCITRDLKWGIPVPLEGFENKVFYVWFDAPIGYMSITACYTSEWRKWWQPSEEAPVTYYEFMAKDNVPFHSVMFPATLLAINKGYLLVDSIMATEYLNYEDGKFSKSRGIGVFGTDAKDTGLAADIFRFYLLYIRPESQDSSFSWEDLASKHNTELLNNIGNFVNRALMFTEKFFDSVIPEILLEEEDTLLLASVSRDLKKYNIVLEKGNLRRGIEYMLSISRHGNQYMQNMKPWELVKGPDEKKRRAGTVIGLSCNVAALLAVIIQPYMPIISDIMRQQMNASDDILVLTDNVNQLLPKGHKIGKPSPLFAKIEPSTVEALKKKFSGRQKLTSPEADKEKCEKFSYKNITSVEDMEATVTEQGNLVRQVKGSGVDKSVWLPHVEILKNMKKHLEELKKSSSIANGVDNLQVSSSSSKSKTRKQGDKKK